LVEKGEPESALGALNKSIQAYPDNPYAVHAYADVQLRVAARRDVYDAVTVQLIGEAVQALEAQHAARDVDSDQYPIVTLTNHHVGALIRHHQDTAAKEAARRYFGQVEELAKRNSSLQVQFARERLVYYLTSGRWQMGTKNGDSRMNRGRSKGRSRGERRLAGRNGSN
jgi:hypothetical protein